MAEPTFRNDPLLAFWRLLFALRRQNAAMQEAALRNLANLGFKVCLTTGDGGTTEPAVEGAQAADGRNLR